MLSPSPPSIWREEAAGPAGQDLEWPFVKVESVDGDELREAAYEVLFASCWSSAGFGGRNTISYAPAHDGIGLGSVGGSLKKKLGLRMRRIESSPRREMTCSKSANGIATAGEGVWRTMTAAERMRQQMRVSEQDDSRLRKTLLRTFVGQMGKRAETIVLPLELLLHLKPSEFEDTHEYYLWQRRQLKILEACILLHPSIHLEQSNPAAVRLREILSSSESKIINTGRSSETMKELRNCVAALAWRSPNGVPADTCHWADGYPINLHLYVALLQSVFDLRDATTVIDEIDELMEPMKKTWSTLGITRQIHNVCFAWVLFQQFVMTGLVEQDLLCAALTVIAEVANDAIRTDKELLYIKVLSSTMASMQRWADKRLHDYHGSFQDSIVRLMENILSLALSAAKIIDENAAMHGQGSQEGNHVVLDSTSHRADHYIRSSLTTAFAKIFEDSMAVHINNDGSEALLALAKETMELAVREKESFSSILKRWHPVAAGVAAVTLHNCYGATLRQYLAGVSTPTNEAIEVLQMAGKVEKILVQMVVEDSIDCEDGGKAIVREMVPYEVDSVIMHLRKTWVDERLKRVKECLQKAKETETWNPKSREEPYAASATELMKVTKQTVDDFFKMPVAGTSNELIRDIAGGLQSLLQGYTSFVASCGSKQSYMPVLPPLTRCNQDSKVVELLRKVKPWRASSGNSVKNSTIGSHLPRPTMSRGTQRLYIRLNTLHYLLLEIQSLDKSTPLAHSSNSSPLAAHLPSSCHCFTTNLSLNFVQSYIQSTIEHVSTAAAFRLVFLDSNPFFYESLYNSNVIDARILPTLHLIEHNLSLLAKIVMDQAQPLAVKEVMKASFEAFLMVLLAGGSYRTFTRSDYEMVSEDFSILKHAFCVWGEGLVAEEAEKEGGVVEGVVALMAQGTEKLVEDFIVMVCEVSGLGFSGGNRRKVPMPPTTGRWDCSDPNTILRVICHRNDSVASNFLKKTFHLPRRK